MDKKEKFASQGYSLTIQGRNVEVSDAIETYVYEKMSKIERFANHILDIDIALDIQKLTHTATIVMKFLHFQIRVVSNTEDLYSAIDQAIEKLLKLIKKYKTKLQDHHKKDLATIDMNVHVLGSAQDETDDVNELIESENLKQEKALYSFHEVVDKETMPLKTLTQDAAVMKLELSGDHFLVFKSEEDLKTKIIYRRNGDKLGIIEIQ